MATPCPSNPPFPPGYTLWLGAVPQPLTAWAVSLLKGINSAPYGTTWETDYGGVTVVARKEYHTWTHDRQTGQLISGICIPGITLYKPQTDGASPPAGTIDTALDGSRAFDKRAFIGSALGAAGVVALFFLALHFAGSATKG